MKPILILFFIFSLSKSVSDSLDDDYSIRPGGNGISGPTGPGPSNTYNCTANVLEFNRSNKTFAIIGNTTDYFFQHFINNRAFTFESMVKFKTNMTGFHSIFGVMSGKGQMSGLAFKKSEEGWEIWYSRNYRKCSALPVDEWFHVAVTYNGQHLKVYSNGKLIYADFEYNNRELLAPNLVFGLGVSVVVGESGGGYCGSTGPQGLPVWCGGGANYAYNFLNGYLSEVRLWNYAKTEEQVNLQMKTRLKGNEFGLLGYWPIDEGSGNILYDKSQNKFHGIINTAEWKVEKELPIDCVLVSCAQGRFKNDNECTYNCPTNKYYDLTAENKVCVLQCPDCTITNTRDKTCINLPYYAYPKTYKYGDIVISNRKVFQCKHWPFTQYCNMLEFEPNSINGYLAWKDLTKELFLLPNFCPETIINSFMIGYDFKPLDVVVMDKKYFRCKSWPYTPFCKQEAYKPTGIYGFVAWDEIKPEQIILTREDQKKSDLIQPKDKTQLKNKKDEYKTKKVIPKWMIVFIALLSIGLVFSIFVLVHIIKKKIYLKKLKSIPTVPTRMQSIESNVIGI